MCAERMGCGKRWVIWILRGTGTASGRPGVSRLLKVNCEGELATAGTTSLLMELVGVAA